LILLENSRRIWIETSLRRNLSVMEIEESNNNNIMADSLRTHELFRSVSEFSSLEDDFQNRQKTRRRHISWCNNIINTERQPILHNEASNKTIFVQGRPPWFNKDGGVRKEPFFIGISGGSASGKTTVATNIIKQLDVQWVTLLSMDAFYKVLTEEQHQLASQNEYNFDRPDAFDFELLIDTLKRLKEYREVKVPIYNFVTHRREDRTIPMYGANVIIFEGIFSFHDDRVRNMMDMKIFVDTDSDIRLCRRLQRDTQQRGRNFKDVLAQHKRHVQPAFKVFIAPTMAYADLIVPRGGENAVAINLIVQHVRSQLLAKGHKLRESLIADGNDFDLEDSEMPSSLHLLPSSPQTKGLNTFLRNKDTNRDEFTFYSKRLIRIVIEHALSLLPYEDVVVQTPQGLSYEGKTCSVTNVCGVSIICGGEPFEDALKDVCKDARVGKILIQTNTVTGEPELYYLKLPENIKNYRVILMDSAVATGAAAMMAIRVLIDHDVQEDSITLVSLLMAMKGVHTIAYAFKNVKIVTSEVDPSLNNAHQIEPGFGDFADRYFGTELNHR